MVAFAALMRGLSWGADMSRVLLVLAVLVVTASEAVALPEWPWPSVQLHTTKAQCFDCDVGRLQKGRSSPYLNRSPGHGGRHAGASFLFGCVRQGDGIRQLGERAIKTARALGLTVPGPSRQGDRISFGDVRFWPLAVQLEIAFPVPKIVSPKSRELI